MDGIVASLFKKGLIPIGFVAIKTFFTTAFITFKMVK